MNWKGTVALLAFCLLASCAARRQQGPSAGAKPGSLPVAESAAPVIDSVLGIPVRPGAHPVLLQAMRQWKGVPYKLGGNTRTGVDCSGLIAAIYPQVYAVQPARTTAQLYTQALPVPRQQLQEGDLVFFSIGTPKPGHAGIYLWDDYFFHASTSRGVMVSRLTEPYWSRYFTAGGRLPAIKSKP
ncbi:MAG: NlpC/P60 family protein [Chitinophagaceae bacterium]|nr:NlpC/P60 family protein [Chitinophagaceae bacterium]